MGLLDESHLLEADHFISNGSGTAVKLAMLHQLIRTDRHCRTDISLNRPAKQFFLSLGQSTHFYPARILPHKSKYFFNLSQAKNVYGQVFK
jgi:hypothetical protein